MDDDKLRNLEGLVGFLFGKADEDPDRVIAMLSVIVTEDFKDGRHLSRLEEAAVLTNAAGVLVNAASRVGDSAALILAESVLVAIIDSGHLEGSGFESAATYNLANSRIELTDIRLREAWQRSDPADRLAACAKARFADRDRLRQARRGLHESAVLSDNNRERGMRLCNLANVLDHSGRWVEAYDAYVRALEFDEANGNAAGNAALLIERVIGAGWDFEGHLCSLYDHYVRWAQAQRAGTVDGAGEHAASRYDALQLLGSAEPVASVPEDADPYAVWVAKHRLALVAALEGVGAGDMRGRWDTITLRSVTDSLDSVDPPVIFTVLNVLKGDYLVARRLAYDAEVALAETGGWQQDRSDPGAYTETLNYAVVGEASSKLVLAHRASLDVLDKTAVAVNEHLAVGDDPKKVTFRRFWFDDAKATRLRQALLHHAGLETAVLSMAELALDMSAGGLYEHAQDVRNAGTHRFVLVHQGLKDVNSSSTVQTMTLDGMLQTCMQSLTVARAAFLYVVAMLEVFEARKAAASGEVVQLHRPDAY